MSGSVCVDVCFFPSKKKIQIFVNDECKKEHSNFNAIISVTLMSSCQEVGSKIGSPKLGN